MGLTCGVLLRSNAALATLAQPPDVPRRATAVSTSAGGAASASSVACGDLILGWQTGCQESEADLAPLSLVQVVADTQASQSSLYADLVEGHAYGIHFSVGSAISGGSSLAGSTSGAATSTQSRREHLQQLFTNASSATLVAQYPLVRLQDPVRQRNFLALQPTFVALLDLPVAGSLGTVATSHTDSGLELDGNLVTQEGTLSLFGAAKVSYAAGNQAFGDAIGGPPAFFYGSWTAGVRILDAVRISLSGLMGAPPEIARGAPVMVSVSLERAAAK